MIIFSEATKIANGAIDPKHEVQVVCGACGYDLDKEELNADTCGDCGGTLTLRQSTKIYATSVPSASGSTLT